MGENNVKFYKNSNVQNFFQGITSVKAKNGKEMICVGNSVGEVHFFENTKETYYSNFVGVSLSNESSITKLDKSDAFNLLFITDMLGMIYIY
mmetsp:Transcript_14478/g.12283  ORF Transcript_14478/g.12283 Transcript_14478/m.12283 type:complete len:92 (+) Transcript_14478:360-635(+)